METTIVKNQKNLLQTYINEDGLEVIINTQTGETFASVKSYARLSGRDKSTISRRLKGVAETLVENAEVLTPGGLQRVAYLITEDIIAEWITKDNPEVATLLLRAGIRTYMHRLAGYSVISTANSNNIVSKSDIDELKALSETTIIGLANIRQDITAVQRDVTQMKKNTNQIPAVIGAVKTIGKSLTSAIQILGTTTGQKHENIPENYKTLDQICKGRYKLEGRGTKAHLRKVFEATYPQDWTYCGKADQAYYDTFKFYHAIEIATAPGKKYKLLPATGRQRLDRVVKI